MEVVTWNENYSVSIPSIDEQHKKLFTYINDFYSQMLGDTPTADIVETTLLRLYEYAKEHFSYEEELLRSNGYPDYIKHKQTHTDFLRKVREFEKQDTLDPQELLFFLQNWLIKHIKGADSAYSRFLYNKGVS
ncbi:MAG: bacteriohemerythrin [Spirochaetia bacterium]